VDLQSVSFPSMIEPLQITLATSCKFEQEFSFMAPVRDMRDVARNEMSLCSCYRHQGIMAFLPSKTSL
jgi:hypothetical protein